MTIANRLGAVTKTGVLLLSLTACHRNPPPFAALQGTEFHEPTVLVSAKEIPEFYTTTGSVVSDERVEISSRLAAYILSIDVREGERVKQKQLLATLDSKDIEASIRVAQANRDQAEAAKKDAEKDVEVSEKLFADGVVTTTNLRKARLQLAAASENLQAVNATLARSVAERQYATILSPVAGVVVARHQRAGNLAVAGAPLITVESDTALLFDTYVAEQRVANIRLRDAATISIDALGRTLSGEVLRVVSSGNPVTRGFEVKISIPATDGIAPGMFGRSEFVIGQKKSVVVPSGALVERGGLTGVFVVGNDGGLRFRWLRTGNKVADDVVVLAGLDEGERIVATPIAKMHEGDRIAVVGPTP